MAKTGLTETFKKSVSDTVRNNRFALMGGGLLGTVGAVLLSATLGGIFFGAAAGATAATGVVKGTQHVYNKLTA